MINSWILVLGFQLNVCCYCLTPWTTFYMFTICIHLHCITLKTKTCISLNQLYWLGSANWGKYLAGLETLGLAGTNMGQAANLRHWMLLRKKVMWEGMKMIRLRIKRVNWICKPFCHKVSGLNGHLDLKLYELQWDWYNHCW